MGQIRLRKLVDKEKGARVEIMTHFDDGLMTSHRFEVIESFSITRDHDVSFPVDPDSKQFLEVNGERLDLSERNCRSVHALNGVLVTLFRKAGITDMTELTFVIEQMLSDGGSFHCSLPSDAEVIKKNEKRLVEEAKQQKEYDELVAQRAAEAKAKESQQ